MRIPTSIYKYNLATKDSGQQKDILIPLWFDKLGYDDNDCNESTLPTNCLITGPKLVIYYINFHGYTNFKL